MGTSFKRIVQRIPTFGKALKMGPKNPLKRNVQKIPENKNGETLFKPWGFFPKPVPKKNGINWGVKITLGPKLWK